MFRGRYHNCLTIVAAIFIAATLFISCNMAIPDWITLSDENGTGDKVVTATTKVNDTGARREANLLIKGEGITKSVNVAQDYTELSWYNAHVHYTISGQQPIQKDVELFNTMSMSDVIVDIPITVPALTDVDINLILEPNFKNPQYDTSINARDNVTRSEVFISSAIGEPNNLHPALVATKELGERFNLSDYKEVVPGDARDIIILQAPDTFTVLYRYNFNRGSGTIYLGIGNTHGTYGNKRFIVRLVVTVTN